MHDTNRLIEGRLERFRTAIVPSASIGDAVRVGYELHIPLREGVWMPVEPLVAVLGDGAPGDGVVVEAVKLAEDGSGDVIVRLYESLGQTSMARVSASFDVSQLREVDLLERPMGQLGLRRDPVLSGDVVTLRPFEIATLRFGRWGANPYSRFGEDTPGGVGEVYPAGGFRSRPIGGVSTTAARTAASPARHERPSGAHDPQNGTAHDSQFR